MKHKESKVYLVYGSPLSGKTTYVKEHAQKGDLIIDVDKIWKCISGCELYERPRELTSIVLDVKRFLINCVKERKGRWNNAYVICSYYSFRHIEIVSKELNAELIHIDTDKETCLKRLYKNGDGRNIAKWEEYINDYFKYSNKGR